MQLSYSAALEVMSLTPVDQAVLLLGPAGVGKSSLARELGRRIGHDAIVEVRDLCSHLPEDLLGLPFREGGVTHYAPPAWLARLARPGTRGVLVLDDLAAAAHSVQVAAFQLVLERRAGDCELAKDVRVIATANRRSDRSGAAQLPLALVNRMLVIEVEADLDDWCRWASAQIFPPELLGFLRFRPCHLSREAAEADESGALGTPRSWANLARVLDAAREAGRILDVAAGFVGEGVALELDAWLRLREDLVDPRELLADPVRALPTPPTEPDVLVALATAVAEAATRERAEPRAFLRALAHISRHAREYAAQGLAHYMALGGDGSWLVEAAREHPQDSTISPLLEYLAAVA